MVRQHAESALGQRHPIHNWEYAAAAARTAATGFAADDVGKLALQADTGAYWRLTDDSPITWLNIANTGTVGAHTHPSSEITDFTEASQDAVGAMAADTTSINLTYTDATPELKAEAIFGTTAGTVAEGDHGHAGVKVGPSATFDGGGSAITTAIAAPLVRVPYACTVTGWYLNADASGSIVIDVERATAGAPTTFASIAGTELPTLSGAQSASDTNLTTWGDTTLDEGDWLRFPVDSAATVAFVVVALAVERTL
jgi:hypothetical protein